MFSPMVGNFIKDLVRDNRGVSLVKNIVSIFGNYISSESYAFLFQIALQDAKELAEFLIKNNLSQISDELYSSAFETQVSQDKEFASFMVEHGATKIFDEAYTTLFQSSLLNMEDKKFLIKHGIDKISNKEYTFAFKYASNREDKKFLIKHGVDKISNEAYSFEFQRALNVEDQKFLIEYGMDKISTQAYNNKFESAANMEDKKFLIEQGIDKISNEAYSFEFQRALNVEDQKFLLDHGKDKISANSYSSAFSSAAGMENIKFLIEQGKDKISTQAYSYKFERAANIEDKKFFIEQGKDKISTQTYSAVFESRKTSIEDKKFLILKGINKISEQSYRKVLDSTLRYGNLDDVIFLLEKDIEKQSDSPINHLDKIISWHSSDWDIAENNWFKRIATIEPSATILNYLINTDNHCKIDDHLITYSLLSNIEMRPYDYDKGALMEQQKIKDEINNLIQNEIINRIFLNVSTRPIPINFSLLNGSLASSTRGEYIYAEANSLRRSEVKLAHIWDNGTFAHEITHYLMQKLFFHNANPYKIGDTSNENLYSTVIHKVLDNILTEYYGLKDLNDITKIVPDYFSLSTYAKGKLLLKIEKICYNTNHKLGTEIFDTTFNLINKLGTYFVVPDFIKAKTWHEFEAFFKEKDNVENLKNFIQEKNIKLNVMDCKKVFGDEFTNSLLKLLPEIFDINEHKADFDNYEFDVQDANTKQAIDSFLNVYQSYSADEEHSEFVVRYPEAIAANLYQGNKALQEILEPLALYWEDIITPAINQDLKSWEQNCNQQTEEFMTLVSTHNATCINTHFTNF